MSERMTERDLVLIFHSAGDEDTPFYHSDALRLVAEVHRLRKIILDNGEAGTQAGTEADAIRDDQMAYAAERAQWERMKL